MIKVDLSLNTIVRECAKNTKASMIEKYIKDIAHANSILIHDIFRYKKFQYDFSDHLSCINDGKQTIGFIGPSYDEFLKKIIVILNVQEKVNVEDNQDLTDKLNSRIALLSSIKTEEELHREFPHIYNDLVEGRKYLTQIEQLEREQPSQDNYYEELKHYYYACGLKRSLERFITTQTEVYRRFVNKRFKYKDQVEQTNYNSYLTKYFDVNKIALYTAYSYLMSYDKISEDDDKEKCLEIIERYMKSNYDKTVAVKTEYENKTITFKDVIELYVTKKYSNNPQLSTRMDAESIMKKYQELNNKQQESLVDWIIIPNGRSLDDVTIRNDSTIRQIKLTEVEKEELRSKGKRKETFYETTNYIAKAVGILRNKGYVAYIYSNKEVLLDTEYDDKKPKSAIGNAIFNFKVEDFETLSKLDKSVLRKHPKVGRIIHAKNWEDRVRKIIDKKGTKEDEQKVKELVKRLSKKGNE